MAHEKHIVECAGPLDPHAMDGIPLCPRRGELDEMCDVCSGRGQWNREIDLVSHRSKRTVCARCEGRGWIETGDDLIRTDDIELSREGRPQWVVRLDPPDTDVGE